MNQGIKQKKRKPERQKKIRLVRDLNGFESRTSLNFFSGSLFATAKVAFITVMIFFHIKYRILRHHAALII